jgi:hypothetical protein
MRVIGYSNYDWEADAYWYTLPTRFFPTVQIEPLVIPRPGTSATFGMSTIGQMTIPGAFGYSGTTAIEDAFMALFQRLNPLDQTPRQLRAQKNDGTLLGLPAVMRMIGASSTEDDVDIYEAHFIAVEPYWTQLTPSTVSVTFP